MTILGTQIAQVPDDFFNTQGLVTTSSRNRGGRLEAGTLGGTCIHPVFPGDHAAKQDEGTRRQQCQQEARITLRRRSAPVWMPA